MGEFELIRRYFAAARCAREGGPLLLGIGDDCALLAPPAGEQLAISSDSMVVGVHFPEECDPFLLAQRGLACAVSDLAAMGAAPLGFTLALTLPSADAQWLQAFAAGLELMAEHCNIRLVGGDTTRGPLNLNFTVFGSVPAGQALTRAGARAGDVLCVGGELGDAAGALPFVLAPQRTVGPDAEFLLGRYWSPKPQLALGLALRDVASAAMDISDGLLADAGHLARASQVQMSIELERLPMSQALRAQGNLEQAQRHALAGGDDYRLLFTVPAQALSTLRAQGFEIHVIGRVEHSAVSVGEVCLLDSAGSALALEAQGYRHF